MKEGEQKTIATIEFLREMRDDIQAHKLNQEIKRNEDKVRILAYKHQISKSQLTIE